MAKIPWEYASILRKSFPFDKTNEKLSEEVMRLDNPYAFFRYFFTDEIVNKVVLETQLYNIQQNPN